MSRALAFYQREILQISKGNILKSIQALSGAIQRLSRRMVALERGLQLPQQTSTFVCSLQFHRALLLLGMVGGTEAVRLKCSVKG